MKNLRAHPDSGRTPFKEYMMITQPSSTLPAHRPLRLLIVDDRPQVRHDLRLLLSLCAELEVVGEACDGLEAVRKTRDLQPEVVLLDLEMPVMDGYEAARQIKTQCPTCRVAAFSIYSYCEARYKAFQAGVDVFIEKGASLQEILQKLGL
jgi:DNA-binding NarL/FixJ family response regulator